MLPTALVPLFSILATLAVVTYSVVVSTTTTLAVPATPMVMLAPELPILTLDVPF